MIIKNISVNNFKTFEKLDISFDNLNIIVGANASGKSNFVNIFKFLNDMAEYGISDAISLQGGVRYLRNSNIGHLEPVSIFINVSLPLRQDKIVKSRTSTTDYELVGYDYLIEIRTLKTIDKFRVLKQEVNLYYKLRNELDTTSDGNSPLLNKLTIKKNSNFKLKINTSVGFPDSIKSFLDLKYLNHIFRDNDEILMKQMFMFGLSYGLYDFNIKFFDFNTNLMKSPSSIISKNSFEENGSNLVTVIQNIIKTKTTKKRFLNIIRTVLPHIEDVSIENGGNKSLILKIKESYSNNTFPSNLLSDGTINLFAIVVALYFEKYTETLFIEEPERNIHPKLLDNVSNLINDIALTKQIFVTTHSPYILKSVNLKNILLVSRDKLGYTHISRPEDNERVRKFIENELGIEELFVDGFLND